MPRPRTLLAVDAMPLVGGRLCLDFVNTTGARRSSVPRERLTRYEDLLVWSRRAGILDVKAADALRRAAATRPDHGARALRRARIIREDLYGVFAAIAAKRRPEATWSARLAAYWRSVRRHQDFVDGRSGFELRVDRGVTALDGMLIEIVLSAVRLLTSDELDRVRRCVECDWLFLDTSKNATRRWCKSTCGNRARARERYKRVRTRGRSQRGD